jgi:hypothetical protein
MRYRLLKNTNEFGETQYVIEKQIGQGYSGFGWEYVFTSVNEQTAREKFAELRARKTKILDSVEIDDINGPNQSEQSAASPS